jgi:hypothetical protein
MRNKKAKSTQEGEREIVLTFRDRLFLPALLPKEGDMLTIVVARDIKEKVTPTQEELKKINFSTIVVGGETRTAWNIDPKDDAFTYKFTQMEVVQIVSSLKELQQNKKVTEDTIGLCEKFEIEA